MASELTLRPFFIIGSPRSGTTLLRFILSSHSQLYVPDETGFLPFLQCDPDRKLDIDDLDSILQRIGKLNRFWREDIVDVAAFHQSLAEPRLPYLLDALYRKHCQPIQVERWGDKTPLYVHYVPQILAIFPQAQFIHVIRDGRDASLSARAKWGDTHWYMDIYYLLYNWRRNVSAGHKAQLSLPADQYFSLTYESLVTNPEVVLRQVCHFLEESFEPDMLQQTTLARQIGGGIDEHVEVQDPIHGTSIGRWRREMNLFEMRLADDLVGDTLLNSGYPLADVGRYSLGERMKKSALATKFIVTDSMRTLLYRTGIITLNRNRR